MSEKDREKAGAREKEAEYRCHCPVCALMDRVSTGREKPHEFFQHLDNARIEVLEAFRSLIDRRIERVKERRDRSSKNITKIKIEEQEA